MPPHRPDPWFRTAQLAAAVRRARGDARWVLLCELLYLAGDHDEALLADLLATGDLRGDDRRSVLERLLMVDRAAYLDAFAEGLRSPSIGVQQLTIARLSELARVEPLAPRVAAEVERWIDHRMHDPHRVRSWAEWEVPAALLALLPSRGDAWVTDRLDDWPELMQPDERRRARETEVPARPPRAMLTSWLASIPGFTEEDGVTAAPATSDPDPEWEDVVRRAMKRYGRAVT